MTVPSSMPANAPSATFLLVSFVELIVIVFSFGQFAKALAPISVIFCDKTIRFTFSFPLKAFAAMDVTLYFVPSIVTVFGIVTVPFAFFAAALYATVGFLPPSDVT